MPTISAGDALGYALSREMARLYAVILFGWLVLSIGTGMYADLFGFAFQERPVAYAITYALLLVGLFAVYGGGIALVYKIVADANSEARRQ